MKFFNTPTTLWLLLLVTGPLLAGSTVSINSFSVDQYDPNLIASDSQLSGHDRHDIDLSATVSYSASPTNAYVFELRFSLRDAAGNAVTVYNESNSPDSEYTVFANFGSLGGGVGNMYNVGLIPVNQLDHFSTYTPRLEIYETAVGGSPVVPTLKASQSYASSLQFNHFNSSVNGDSAVNVLSTLDGVTGGRNYMVATVSGLNNFDAQVNFTLQRYDNFLGGNPAAVDNITMRFNMVLRDSAGNTVPLASSSDTAVVSMARYNYVGGVPTRLPATASFSETITYVPASPSSLSMGETYTLEVTLAHDEDSGTYKTANTSSGGPTALRYLNGTLYFDGHPTTLTGVTYVEVPGSVSGTVATGLLIPSAGGGSAGAGYTYGNGGMPLQVDIHSNGTAYFTGNAPGVSLVPVIPPSSPDTGTISGIAFERSNLTLGAGGAVGNLEMCLPTGLGYTLNPAGKLLKHRIFYPSLIGFDNSFQPTPAALSFTMAVNTWFCEESKPVLWGISTVDWGLGGGSLTLYPSGSNEVRYVRRDELDELDTYGSFANSDGALKRANDLYWRRVETITTPTITVTAGGGTAMMSFDVALNDPAGTHEFFTHFPYDAKVKWSDSAYLSVQNDRVDPSLSAMAGVDPILMGYGRDCGGEDCGSAIGPATLALAPTGGKLLFTEDGGLVGEGVLTAPADITWGYIPGMGTYAQSALDFSDGVFQSAGIFHTGSSLSVAPDRGPSSILLAGAFSDGSISERLGAAAYEDGFSWYSGHNFKVAFSGANDGISVLAGNTGIPPYPLTEISKYYVRLSGVSGIHQSVNGSFLPPDIYGYDMSFDVFGLSYLSSRQVDAVTWGNLDITHPSAFNLDFTNIEVDCLGALTGADIDGNLDKTLAYWNGDFTPLSLAFARNADDSCDPGTGYLAVGVSASMSHVPNLFYGTLGFKADGNLITGADNLVEGLNSRLSGPNRVSFAGYQEEVYNLDLAGKLVYNNFDLAAGAEGFLNLPGRLDVPFFEDMKVHLQTRGDKDSTIAPLHLMGGWPDNGFGTAADNFFTSTVFDNDHKAFAGGTVATYRDSGSDLYLPRAQQNWLSVVNFDYPVKWSDFDRSFTSQGVHKNKFLIVDVEHDLPFLTSRQAELTFGAGWDGIPFLSLSGLAGKLVDDQVMRPFRAAVDEGKDAMAEMLSDQVQKLFDPVLDRLLGPLVSELYDSMKESYENEALSNGTPVNELLPFADWQAVYSDVVTCYLTGGTLPPTSSVDCPLDDSLLEILENVIGEVDDVSGLLSQIDNYLEKTELVLDAFTSSFKDPEGRILSDTNGMFVCDESGNIDFGFAEELLKRLLEEEDLGIDPAIIGQALDSLLHPLLEDATPTLKRLAEKLLKLKHFIGDVREYLATASDFVANLQDQLQLVNAEVNSVVTVVDGAIQSFFTEMESLSTMAGSPFDEYTQAEMEAFITDEIKDAFYSSEIGTRLQVVIKQQLFDTNGAICQGIDNVFGELNKIIRDLLSTALQDLDEKIIPFLDKLNSVVGAGKLTGYAHIVDDAIRYARLDAHLEWSVPKKMDFDGFIEIKQLNAEGSGNACYANTPGVINEVTVGANHVPINWGSADMKADVYGKATFDTTSGLELLGIGGGFEMVEGQIKFEKFTITELGAALALGEKEAFLAAKAHATFDAVEAGIGAFFGKTCTIDPLAMVDADIASVIGDAPFTGAYLYGEAWIPIFNYGCPLRISAGAGIGLGYFKEGPTWVGKMKLGVSGEALCVVSVRGELVLIGVKQGSDFRYKGTGTISGSIGKCKWFCIKFKKSITVEK